jgi:hypothetical protein
LSKRGRECVWQYIPLLGVNFEAGVGETLADELGRGFDSLFGVALHDQLEELHLERVLGIVHNF